MSDREIDIGHLRTWIGSQVVSSDVVSEALVERFMSTFDLSAGPSANEAPAGIHWCLSPHIAPTSLLGADGHPKRGGFLPPVPLPRRMWAGGSLTYLRPFLKGQIVTRTSTVNDVILKHGRTGPLVFVNVAHDYHVNNEIVLKERQDIVYRGLAGAENMARANHGQAMVKGASASDHYAGPTLLFRYSALTFNSHRIHYDRNYCIEEENYPGLVVHGPLQATYLLRLAVERNGWPSTFDFRSHAPLFDGGFSTHAETTFRDGNFWICDPAGIRTMSAEATWI